MCCIKTKFACMYKTMNNSNGNNEGVCVFKLHVALLHSLQLVYEIKHLTLKSVQTTPFA